MKSDRVSKLRDLAAQLSELIGDPSAENAIVPGNGYDESILVGSPDSYLRLAQLLIEVVGAAGDRGSWHENALEEDTVGGVSVVGTNQIKEAFNEFSPVWLICGYLSADDKSAKELAQRLAESVGLAARIPKAP
jgi:hypothetical protein